MAHREGMDNRDPYSIVAGILPPLLGLGLIELYIERDLGIGTVVAGMMALALLMVVVSALIDIQKASGQRLRRRRRHL